jgi:4-hydroxy-tetrahydrodipicolinate synthase
MADMMEAALAGDLAGARALHYRMYSLMKALFCAPNPVPAKMGVELLGRIQSGLPRLPLAPLDENCLEKLKAAMGGLALI